MSVSKNNITVIAFYPGGGGNRYLLSLLNQEYSTLGTTYDRRFLNQSSSFRYLLADQNIELPRYCLTHCMNASHIEQVLNPKDIIFIDTDLQQSLQRQWYHDKGQLYSKNSSTKTPDDYQIILAYQGIKDSTWPAVNSIEDFNALEQRIRNEVIETMQKNTSSVELESAWETIDWHHQYYAQYPVEFKDYSVVSVSGNTPYAKVMQQELAYHQSELFGFCWDTYKTYGREAPIVDLYNQLHF